MYFIAHLEDGSIVQGKSILSCDTGWQALPDKPILRLGFINPIGDIIVLQNYEEYGLLIESLQFIGQGPREIAVYLLGARNGRVAVYRLVLTKEKEWEQTGDVTLRLYPRGQEYMGKPYPSWKVGAGLKPAPIEGSAELKPCGTQGSAPTKNET